MEWPEPVHADTIGFKKQSLYGRPRKEVQNRYTEGQQEEARRLRESFPFIPSGVTLQAGSRGATSLKAIRADEENLRPRRRRAGQDAPRKRWNWQFANAPDLDHRLRVSEDFAEFFPPTIYVKDEERKGDPIPPQPFRKKAVHTRSRGNSPLAQRSQLPPPPAMPHSDTVNEKYSDEEDLSKDDEMPECNPIANPADPSAASERDDGDPVPPGQQIPSSIPPFTTPPIEDAQKRVAEAIKERHSRLHLGDNRNALATIQYEVPVDPALYGFETHTLHFLAFAMGEKGNELNISPFRTFPKTLKRPNKMPAFVPLAKPSFLCRDRILQISVSNKRRSRYPYICLAVRTETLIYYLLVTPNNTSVFPYPKSNREVQVDLLSLVDSDSLNGAHAVDICMHPTHFQQCLIATDTGALYRWSMVRRASGPEGYIHEGKLSHIMTIPASARFDVAHRFYRAVWGRREGTVVFVNATRLWFLDLENSDQLVLNTIDMSRTTSLFTSLDRTVNEGDAEFMALSTTEMVMWLDTHDGQVAMSWMHGRKGENLRIESIASDHASIFLLRSYDNPKGTFFHVLETIQGIRSIIDPYDCLIHDPLKLASARTASWSMGYASLILKDAPITLSLLLNLNLDGKLSCRLFEEPVLDGTAVSRRNNNFRNFPAVVNGFHPRELVSRPVILQSDSGSKDAEDEEANDDMDVDDDNDGLSDFRDGDEQALFPCQRIKTRDFWNSLAQNGEEELPQVSLASLRSLLNDTEQLPPAGVFTLHELLAISSEGLPEDGEEKPDALKAYSLSLLKGADPEGMQLDDLLQQSSSMLQRADLRKAELREAIHSLDGDDGLAREAKDTQERLLERYSPTSAAYSRTDYTQDVEAALARSSLQLLCDMHLSATTAWHNPERTDGAAENDQISENLSKLSVSSKPASLHPTAYLKPICKKELDELGPSTIKSLLGQWQTGSDLSSYTWPGLSNHRDSSPDTIEVTNSAAGVPRPRSSAAKQHSLSMPAMIASSMQTSFVPPNSAGASLPTLNHQSQVHFEADTQSQTQDFASTQLVQGPFGNRNPLSFRRSLGKKRTIGF